MRSGPRFSEKFEEFGKRKPVEDGVVARSRRGAIGESWWSGRFLAVLTQLGVGGRLDRGKTYARAGQVVDLAIEPGAITATVQGSRDEPYRARIGLRPFADEAWDAVLDALAADSWFAAALLAGEVPDDLEDLLGRVGLSLFPQGSGELPMDCSCPDWSVPCKHLAAVAYLAAEEFDVDPFALLRWRGRDRATLLAALRDRRDAGAGSPTALEDLLDRFHRPGVPVPDPPTRDARSSPADALLDDLPPLRLGGEDVREVLRPLYARLADGPPE
ncbi:SWIM zinc finger family protein [Actinomycetospora sp. NBRC 106375]|uniref:SWIM zinc finger family protein n=1 Tax=Actinomycetospora sp. NBRC 106375 TaxID=3032207 RepID=UPI00255641A1|nr:SWIM zinc finger family protein [Actinomycetospora sp. NBRC 106375]